MWALAILIIPAFVIWGAGTSGKDKGNKPDYAGKLFGKKISYEEYGNMWNVARDYAVKSLGNNAPAEYIDQITWSRIILIEGAKRENLSVTDKEVVESLASFPAFRRNGSFDKKLYKSMLGDTARQLEEKLRDDLLISKLKNKTTAGINVTDQEVKDEYKNKFEQTKLFYVLIPFSDFEKDVAYKDSDLENFYNQDSEAFKKSDQVDVKYLEIPYSRFESEVTIKDGQIQRFFEEHITDFKNPDSNENSILDDKLKNSIREKLALQRKISLAEELGYNVLDQINQKKNLEEPANSNSLAIKETGFFSADDEIPGIGWSYEFVKTSFELEKNQINNMLIKTDNALYIIQLKNKKGPYVPDYAEVKDAVKKAFLKEESIKLSGKKSKKIYLDIAGEKFEASVKKYGLEAKQTDFITRDSYIPEIGPAKEFVDAADSVKIGGVSKPFKTFRGWVMLAPIQVKPIDEVKFMEEKSKFKEALLAGKKEQEFGKYFQDLQKQSGFISYTAAK